MSRMQADIDMAALRKAGRAALVIRDEGWNAFYGSFAAITDNPYPSGSFDAYAWNLGWCDAERDEERA